MSSYITLSHVQVQNANCIAGITYGFPAVTQFLGFVRALSIKLQSISLDGCVIACHEHQVHSYRTESINKEGKIFHSDYFFKQTKNPAAFPYQEKNIGGDTPIIEEGKMHLTVSLVIECEGFSGAAADLIQLLEYIKQLCLTQKLAGGVITQIKDVFFDTIEKETDFRRIRRRLMPGFILRDRSEYLTEHLENLQQDNSNVEMLDAWLDFSALKYKAISKLQDDESPTEQTEAEWEYTPSTPYSGWLVPITTGYRAISELYEKGKATNTRDPSVPFCFTEAVYGVGEWQSPHRINDLQQIIWRYVPPEDGWYLCKQQSNSSSVVIEVTDDDMDQYIFND